MTGKLAKETIKASYPKACCRYGWITTKGVKEEYYEIMPSLAIFGSYFAGRYNGPTPLGKAKTRAQAWIVAAEKLIAQMGRESALPLDVYDTFACTPPL